jgi:putative NIF3 family GTP cyclohydrolase 1 type 2
LRRIGLALEFSSRIEDAAADCDLLFLHRPFSLPNSALPDVTVLAAHLGFDAHLTMGYNPALANELGLRQIQPLFRPDSPEETIPIGMIGTLDKPVPLAQLQAQITRQFGGLDDTVLFPDSALVGRIAVMNALNPTLIALAAEQGAGAYLTGQMRESTRLAAQNQRMSLFAAGHRRIELWGLRRLAWEISQAFPDLEICLLEA